MPNAQILLFCCLFSFVGCEFRFPTPPRNVPSTTARVTIFVNGEPVPNVWITLVPFGGTIGDHCLGQTGPDGVIHFDQVPIGPLQVRIETPAVVLEKVPSLQSRTEWIRGVASPIEVITTPEPLNWSFDLVRTPVRPPADKR